MGILPLRVLPFSYAPPPKKFWKVPFDLRTYSVFSPVRVFGPYD